MARRRWLPLVASLALLGGCGPAASPVGAGADPVHQRARDELARYDKAVADAGGQQRFVPVGELTGQIGMWEISNGGNKVALLTGHVVADTALSDTAPPPGTVVWEGGATMSVPLISAAEALRQLVAAVAGQGDCTQLCTPLHVTAARLSTARIQTTRGPATVPAWEYTLQGTAVRVTRAGVAKSSTVTVNGLPGNPYEPVSLGMEATTTLGSRQLTVSFTGAPEASKPCGADYTGEAVESANAVVVIISGHAHTPAGTCPSIGARRTAVVDLAQPLGERAVFEVQTGFPVPVTVTA
jgi:hypothetical protein